MKKLIVLLILAFSNSVPAQDSTISRWWHPIKKDWVVQSNLIATDQQMTSWGYTKKTYLFQAKSKKEMELIPLYRYTDSKGSHITTTDKLAHLDQLLEKGYKQDKILCYVYPNKLDEKYLEISRWWHDKDKDWVTTTELVTTDNQMVTWGYSSKKTLGYYYGSDSYRTDTASSNSSPSIIATIVRGNHEYNTTVEEKGDELDENARRLCVTKVISVDESPQKKIGFLVTSGDHSQIYPGAIFKQNAFTEGNYAKPNLSYNSFNIAIDLTSASAGLSGITIIPNENGSISKASLNEGMSNILNANKSVINPTNFSYTVHKIEHEQDLAIMAYGEFNGFGASLKAKFNYGKKTKRNMYVVKFHQKYYSFLVDSDQLINLNKSSDPVKSEDLYISEVSYGRIGFIRIESDYEEEIIAAAVDAAYSGAGMSAKLGGKVDFGTVNKEWKFTAYAVGGDQHPFHDFEQFHEWIKNSRWNPNVSQIPIGYKLNFINDNTVADVRMTTTYTKRDCRPYTASKITFLGLGYLNIVDGHDHGDCSRIGLEVDIEMMVDGKYIKGKNDEGVSTSKLVSWRETEHNRKDNFGNPVWRKRPFEIVRLHDGTNDSASSDQLLNQLKSEDKALSFVIDQNELNSNNVKFKIISKIESCHKSCGHCSGFHCGIKTIDGKNYKEFYLKNILIQADGSIKDEGFFDSGIISGTESHTWKLFFKLKNF